MARTTHPEHLDIHAPTRAGRRRFALGTTAFVVLALAALAIGGIYVTDLFAAV